MQYRKQYHAIENRFVIRIMVLSLILPPIAGLEISLLRAENVIVEEVKTPNPEKTPSKSQHLDSNLGKRPSLRLAGDSVSVKSLETLKDKDWQTVTLFKAEFTNSIIEAINKAKSIHTLRLIGKNLSNHIYTLRKVPGLKDLELGTSLTTHDLLMISKLTQLEQLSFSQKITINVTGASYLAKMTNLKSLSFYNVEIDDTAFTELKPLSKLEHLNLSYTLVSDEGLKTLAFMPHLKELHISFHPRFRSLKRISDDCIPFILKLTELEDLSISGSITDNGLKQIAQLTKLKRLSILNTQITGRGLGYFKNSIIEHLTINASLLPSRHSRGPVNSTLKNLSKWQKLKSIFVVVAIEFPDIHYLQEQLPGVGWFFNS